MALPAPSQPSPVEGERGAVTVEPADYFSSEEEFQMQLALAISASNSEFREDPDGDQIRAATLLSLGTHRIDRGRQDDGTAESLSRRYWDYNVLDYGEKVVDGFYDIFGLSNDFTNHGKMPSLHDLQSSIGDLGFEVIFVNRAIDSALVELEQVAHCIALDSPATEVVFLVQRISELVSQHMGGPVKDANDMLARWIEKSTELRMTLQTSLLPIGCINLGLSRHRALLFKVLADNVGIPCKLVKGSHYTGIDDDAVNIIKYGDNREFLVDLMAAPGTLIPADVLSSKDASSNPYNPMVGQNILAWETDTTHDNFPKSGYDNDHLDGNKMVDKSSSHNKAVLVPFVLGESSASTASSSSENTESPFTQGLSNQCISNSSGALIEDTANVTVNDNTSMSDKPIVSTTGDAFDSRNLFAELNPFQAVGIVKPTMVKVGDSKPNEYQRSREPVASGPGRPQHQSPLVQ
ncbi:hypothetical protein HPP92_023184 [Vanilla planifolia]|uniref:EDR1/CTR1/ARMC3-like peptidase-like domain-containing protein n=1 Tax=Vanilla planifolia TaxID=51239 RepID=A0A835PTH3_VANPL|nr:hypothetical protein HPP92_023184 [Vanilla planifolia]